MGDEAGGEVVLGVPMRNGRGGGVRSTHEKLTWDTTESSKSASAAPLPLCPPLPPAGTPRPLPVRPPSPLLPLPATDASARSPGMKLTRPRLPLGDGCCCCGEGAAALAGGTIPVASLLAAAAATSTPLLGGLGLGLNGGKAASSTGSTGGALRLTTEPLFFLYQENAHAKMRPMTPTAIRAAPNALQLTALAAVELDTGAGDALGYTNTRG